MSVNQDFLQSQQSRFSGIGEELPDFENVVTHNGEYFDRFFSILPQCDGQTTSPVEEPTIARTDSFPTFSSFETSFSYSSSITSATTLDSLRSDNAPDLLDIRNVTSGFCSTLGSDTLEPIDQFPGLDETPIESAASSMSKPIPIAKSRRRPSSNAGRRLDSTGFVNYEFHNASQRLVPSSSSSGVQKRGRSKPLSPESRKHAADVRKIKACTYCRGRKGKCGLETPCKSCVDRYKSDLVLHPCRGQRLKDWTDILLSDNLGWHPKPRTLDDFLGPGCYATSPNEYIIPLSWGFGPSLPCSVRYVWSPDLSLLYHNHFVYEFPPNVDRPSYEFCTQAVMPVVLSKEENFDEVLDYQMSILVDQNFHKFPNYFSDLSVLQDVYQFYLSLSPPHSIILNYALKLLVLVHTGGEVTVPADDPVVQTIMSGPSRNYAPYLTVGGPMPCFIRGQLGRILPKLARRYLNELLERLELICLSKECDQWPVVLATLAVLLMALESIQYQSARVALHAVLDDNNSPKETWMLEKSLCQQGIDALIIFYRNCFPSCHRRLLTYGEDERSRGGNLAQGMFIQSLRESIRNSRPYIEERKYPVYNPNIDDFTNYFDRLLANFLIPT